ncbi:hypothetical protein U0070_005944 [Myodes glareolus]|uniref:Uncharacterized protein n=1 Tax=Myodes glareolus TaxID=447135 RepID=A0AAW0HL86_MYOGA
METWLLCVALAVLELTIILVYTEDHLRHQLHGVNTYWILAPSKWTLEPCHFPGRSSGSSIQIRGNL